MDFDAAQLSVLEQVHSGKPLPEVLVAIVRMIEGQAPRMLCSILLYDKSTSRLRGGAAPSLPAEYVTAIDGTSIGPLTGSCGAAAFHRVPAIATDIATHPAWVNYRHLALPHGLLACWSTPIFSPEGDLLGTFAMYYGEKRGPTEQEIVWVNAAAHLAAIAITRGTRG